MNEFERTNEFEWVGGRHAVTRATFNDPGGIQRPAGGIQRPTGDIRRPAHELTTCGIELTGTPNANEHPI